MVTKPKEQRRDRRADAAGNKARRQIRLERDVGAFGIRNKKPVVAIQDDCSDARCQAESNAMNDELPDDVVLRGHGNCRGLGLGRHEQWQRRRVSIRLTQAKRASPQPVSKGTFIKASDRLRRNIQVPFTRA
jgi:hypothetical protein